MDWTPTALFVALGATLICTVYHILRWISHGYPLPPGPRGLPLIGNVHDFPKPGKLEFQHWLKHKDIYGPISSVTIFGQTFVILNDADTALELLRDHANTNSGRPRQTYSMEMVGWKDGIAFVQPNDVFKIHRRNFARVASSKPLQLTFDHVQEQECARFLCNVLHEPNNVYKHIRGEVGAVILRTTYGYTPTNTSSDPLIDLAERAMLEFADASTPGRYLVDTIPQLQYLPDWFPGTEFKRKAERMKKTCIDTTELPYLFVKQQIRQGKQKPSFLSTIVQEDSCTPEMEQIHKWSALSLFAGGTDTTVSSLTTFLLAMVRYPDAQTEAQRELDRVTSGVRLPTIADKGSLPYTQAIVSEVLRWIPVAAMALPHASQEEQLYKGYRIPKGALIMPNSRWFLHDPKVYPSPETFRPERFLSTSTHTPEPDPRRYAFGYGRRICPGQAMAERTLFLTIAQALTVFNISSPVNADKFRESSINIRPGVISHPERIEVSVFARSEEHSKMIQKAFDKYHFSDSDADELKDLAKGRK